MAFYKMLKSVGGPSLRGFYKPWIRGAENIPTEGAAIIASNHNAVWDSVFLPAMIDRELVFLGKADYFSGSGFKGWATKNFMKAVGTIPVDRAGGKAAEASLQAGLRRLETGELFGIYPEGTRSPDGRLYRGRTGVARLALMSGAPVIPVAMIGTHAAQPVGKRIPSRVNIGIDIGKPLDFSRYRGLQSDRYTLRAVTDEIMYNIMLLSGQEYVDLYAADVKARLAAQGQFDGPIPAGARPVEETIETDEVAVGSDGETALDVVETDVEVEETVEVEEEPQLTVAEITAQMYEEDLEADKRKQRLRDTDEKFGRPEHGQDGGESDSKN